MLVSVHEELVTLALGVILGSLASPLRRLRLANRLAVNLFGAEAAPGRPAAQAALVAAGYAAVCTVAALTLYRVPPFILLAYVPLPWVVVTRVVLGAVLLGTCLDPRCSPRWGSSFALPALGYALGGVGWPVAWAAGRGLLAGMRWTPVGPAAGRLLAALEAPGERLARLLWAAVGRRGPAGLERDMGTPAEVAGGMALVLRVCLAAVAW